MKIGIIGLGLIGGSIGRALEIHGENEVFAFDTDEQTMLKGELLRAFSNRLDKNNISSIDILLIALYPQATISALREYVPLVKNGCIVVDCAGIKRQIVDEMRLLKKAYPNIDFVGAHPMAGKEFSGIGHSSVHLLNNSSVLVVPVESSLIALSKLKKIFFDAGAERVVYTSAIEHDSMISYTSQLAHIVSSAYVNNPKADEYYGFTAGSFRDMTRVAKLNPEMWTQIMLANNDFLVSDLDVFILNLQDFKDALIRNDEEKLTQLLCEGNKIKQRIEEGKTKKVDLRSKRNDV